MTGLETVIDIGALEHEREQAEKERVWNVLSDPDCVDRGNNTEKKLNHMVSAILMRARFNSQRHYEVYTIQTDPSITADQLRELFEQSPQSAADLIRERGNKIYSDRVLQKTQLIV